MAISAFKRYEMKFILSQEQLEALTPILLMHMNPDEYCRNGSYYSIYNIYYDTLDNGVIRHSLSKPYYKEKLRLRSYEIPNAPNSEVYLELKKKIGGIVNKRRAVLPLQSAYEFVGTGKLPDTKGYMNRQVIREIAYYLQEYPVVPAAYISYERMAFFGKEDREFRVTVDRNITSRRTDLLLESGSYGPQLLDGHYLMEVKISDSVPMWLANSLSMWHIFKTNFSKYGREFQEFCSHGGSESVLLRPSAGVEAESARCVNF